jgi:quinol monooxygenase YgiN
MLTNWIPKETLAALNEGFVVAIMLEAKEGEADAVAENTRKLAPLAMTEPKMKLFLPYQSPTNPALFFVFELYTDESGWAEHQQFEHFKVAIADLLPRLKRRERIPFIPFLAH